MYNIIKPKKDEMLISYLIRFAKENALDPIRFINVMKEREKEFTMGIIDDKIPIVKIKKELFKDMSLIDVFRKFSLNDALSPFYVDYKQFAILYSAAQQQYGFDHFESSIKNKGVLTKPKICPECCKNGLVLYRHHNLPGVNVCTEHKIPLSEYIRDGNSYDKRKMLNLDSYKPIEINDLDYELAIAEFSKCFMDCAFDINKNDMYSFIYEHVDPNQKTSGRRIRDGFEFEKGIKKIYEKYKTINELSKVLKQYHSEPKQKEYYEEKGYRLLSEPRNNVVELEHMECGTRFLTNSWALGVGFGCPVCSQKQTKDETIKKAIHLQSKNTFTYVDNSFDGNGVVDIVHTCGKHKKIRFADYLGYTPVCECEEHANADKVKVQRRLKALSQDDFICENHPNKNKIITTCKKCGRTQTIHRDSFKEHRRCKYCEKENRMRKILDKNTKGLYEILEYPTYDNEKVKLKCLKCGNVFISDYLRARYKCKCLKCSENKPSYKNGSISKVVYEEMMIRFKGKTFNRKDINKICVELYTKGLINKIPANIASWYVEKNAISIIEYKNKQIQTNEKCSKKTTNERTAIYKLNEDFIKQYKA